MIKSLILIITILVFKVSFAQNNYYWVFFKTNNNGIKDGVNAEYLKKIKSKKLEIIGTSKWFNAAFVQTKKGFKIEKISKYSFVKKIEKSRNYVKQTLQYPKYDSNDYKYTKVQLSMLGLSDFHKNGNTGKGVTLALFDAGFYKVDSLIAFESLRNRNGILATKDFVKNDSNVYDDDTHGMYVLSIIAGFVKDSVTGAAPDVNFLLARTEDVHSEKHIEEFNWIKALEWADSIGVDIIHSSLGYSVFDTLQGDYTYQDMDGESTIITRAAQLAFSKGIFITNSAGNEGAKKWKYITAPCDGEDVLCVGAVDINRNKSNFSSFGPSADGRVKPDVMAMGTNVTITGVNNEIRTGSGTSFSGPLVAGMIACLKQKFPNVNNKIILDAVRKSGNLYSTPNDSMGYGIPNVNKADSLIRKKLNINSISNIGILKIYPNPTSSIINIESDIEINDAEIRDLIGKKHHLTIENKQINLCKLNPGIYFLKLNNYRIVKILKN